MAENQYRRYLEDQQNKEQNSSALGNAMGLGAALGGGLAAFRYRRQIAGAAKATGNFASGIAARNIARMARSNTLRDGARNTGSYLKALDHAMTGASPLGFLTTKGRERFSHRLDDSLTQSFRGIQEKGDGPISKAPLSVMEQFDQYRRGLRTARSSQVKQLRMDKISESLQGSMTDKMFANVRAILNDQDDEFFRKPSDLKIEGLIERYTRPTDGSKYQYQHSLEFGSSTEKNQFINKMLNTLDTYKDTSNLEKNFLKGKRKDLKEITYNKFKEGLEKKDNFFTKMMSNIGYRQATVKDAIDHNLMDDTGFITPGKYGEHRSRMAGARLKQLAEQDRDVMRLIADDKVFINKKGELLDFRGMGKGTYNALSAFRDNVQVPFLRFNPLDLMHFTSYQGMKEAPYMYMLRRGTIDPLLGASRRVETMNHPMAHNQDAAVGTLSREYMYMNGSVYDVGTLEKVKDDVYLASARFGAVPRALAGMANLHRQDYRDRTGFMGKVLDVLDLGKQETDSVLARTKTVFTKFGDPDWERNQLKRLRMMYESGTRDLKDADGIFRNTYSLLEQKTTRLSDDAADYLNEHVKRAYGDVNIDLRNLNTDTEVMTAVGRLNAAITNPGSGVYSDPGLEKQISQVWKQYYRNPTEAVKGKRVLSDGAADLPESVSFLDASETDLVSAVDDARRLIHQHAARQLRFANDQRSAADFIREGIREGRLKESDMDDIRNLESLTTMRQWWEGVYKGSPTERNEALNQFITIGGNRDRAFSQAFEETVNDFTPLTGTGPGDKPPQHFGYVGFVTVNKARGWHSALEQYNANLMQGNSSLKSGTKAALNVLSQPFAGRKNMEDVTTASLAGYYMGERLDNAFAKIGLGLSQRNRASMQGIIGNQLGRRVVLPYMAYQQMQYFGGALGMDDQLADAYVNMHQDVGFAKEVLGLNDIIGQGQKIFAGADQIAELPFMKVFNFATFGLFSDSRSHEELEHYYTSGEDEIRKGRYWGIGSGTAWMGGKIDRYEPNWYRKLKSDYKFSENMYGSRNEYYANSWVPTLTNPLAPLTYLLGNHDHYEKKLMEERPYAAYGGIKELGMLPIVGAPLNATIGRVLSPHFKHPELEKSHRQYLEELNNYYSSQYEAAQSGGAIELLPAGGYRMVSGVSAGGGGGMGIGIGTGSGSGTGGGAGYGIGGGGGAATQEARAQLTMINMAYEGTDGPSLGAGGSPVRSITSLNDLRDPDIVADLSDIGAMGSVSGTIRDSFYSMSEVAGIYGFGVKSLLGFEEGGRGMVLDPSSRMMSYTRMWWDMEMGSLDFRGGQFSEIFRRYVPRDPNKNYWNPIRNTMPDWLPGVEYFTDFKHGDPYTKIAKGEIRLPGDAYEKLYKLHPDALGEYGAFDRFRILADVAPYSENYKFYRRVVSQMNQAGMLEDGMVKEYAEIRDQVSERKKKYNFYHERFQNSDINVEDVTVRAVVDANTFITEEYGWDNPIKLAGVSIRQDDQEAQDFAGQFIYSGAKLKIGLDADPLFRIRDDMMDTMRAVVYTGDNEQGLPWYMSSKGQNLNNILANRSFGGFMGIFGSNNVTIKDDKSATATRALFSEDQVTVGKIWESLSHDIFPNIPAIGPLFDKFLQVRSPLEMYKRQEVYGKAWRPWNEPISGWVQPMIETIAERHPLLAAAQGAGIGWLATKKKGTKWGTLIGGLVGGTVSALRVFNEAANSLDSDQDAWIPERRKKEREINEYFDRLKYVKYKGLYEKASQLAKSREGVDLEALLQESEDRGGANKGAKRFLEAQKKYLAMRDKLGYGDEEAIKERIGKVRQDLKDIEADRSVTELGPNAMLALRYRAEYESTLYGADPGGDMQQIFRALPSKDREFFTEFMNAAPDEREEILRLVPKDQRRFYQARWGLDVDKQESLRSYFSRNFLPDEDWVGWEANTSLDSVKVKVVQNEGLELTEFGFWDDDVQRAQQSNVDAVSVRSVSHNIDIARLEKVLKGAGLEGVSVSMTTSKASEGKIELAMNLLRDRKDEITRELNNNLGSLFS